MQRLKTRPQFQAAMAGGTVSRTPHFALHRLALTAAAPAAADLPPEGPDASPMREGQALFVVPGSHPTVWLGAMVPKRWAKRAVTRNTIKRQIYQLASEFEPRLLPAAHVVRLRAGFDRKQFISATSEVLKQAVRAELTQLLRKACVQPAKPQAKASAPALAKGAPAPLPAVPTPAQSGMESA
ncbi:ribonuclease P protein component [Curvibacter sp. HBC28]|uniref:Ribonuclease P protein component n=1 Tax=Curvibacter microcysteis TaxID=3026419 RepID=A0ABT5MBQ6_9BURK|nr:ribonuclease P protein component [Curvibacter sp. HBC28]MDD0813988.1 ribonuclease P protein component [Curvibacter sp. HBC28]